MKRVAIVSEYSNVVGTFKYTSEPIVAFSTRRRAEAWIEDSAKACGADSEVLVLFNLGFVTRVYSKEENTLALYRIEVLDVNPKTPVPL